MLPAEEAVDVAVFPVVVEDRRELVEETKGIAKEQGGEAQAFACAEGAGGGGEAELFGHDVEAAAEAESVIQTEGEGALVVLEEEGRTLVDEGAFDPDADAEVPLAVDREAVLGDRRDRERIEGVHDGDEPVDRGLAVMIGRRDLALEERDLDTAAELGRFLVGRGEVEAAAVAVAVEAPGPEVGVAPGVIAEEEAVDAVGELEGIAGVEAIEPHQGAEERGRAEAELLETDAGLEAGGREAEPAAVGLDIAVGGGGALGEECERAVGVGRSLGVEGDGRAEGERELDLGDETEGEEGFEGGVEARGREARDHTAERESRGGLLSRSLTGGRDTEQGEGKHERRELRGEGPESHRRSDRRSTL
jgi:hypothetical protein